ncbi:hypothetical protein X743_34505 [Mesorhizobium sp. LNHC252B00]|uniref:hypothetical protein n=1 Tax=Mesorhizobium sp. LNHC252B00 TaxID=1287252 RepID=UPI0003CF25DA|nr:hypothetical protein [Mesorhizobium sp. LNHC252B00]ESY62498.1 hypothetical protein X743_34505 [Mesorhizobium sp. LNHC252B00]
MASATGFAALAMEEPARNKAAEACIESVVGDAVIWAGHDVDAGHLSQVIRDVRGGPTIPPDCQIPAYAKQDH